MFPDTCLIKKQLSRSHSASPHEVQGALTWWEKPLRGVRIVVIFSECMPTACAAGGDAGADDNHPVGGNVPSDVCVVNVNETLAERNEPE